MELAFTWLGMGHGLKSIGLDLDSGQFQPSSLSITDILTLIELNSLMAISPLGDHVPLLVDIFNLKDKQEPMVVCSSKY